MELRSHQATFAAGSAATRRVFEQRKLGMQPGSFYARISYARISAMACVAVVLPVVVLFDAGRAAADDTVPSTAVQPVRVVRSEQPLPTSRLAEKLAQQVTIYRDPYGVPHIDGPTDESVVFGFAFAQAEDYFWQIEDVMSWRSAATAKSTAVVD